jgi:hypothetical protein
MNDYIAYLNSLHNIKPAGANALAESQALSPHFKGIYEPFPLAARLHEALSQSSDTVIILTGHAGDGKTTVAIDVFQRLTGCAAAEPLASPMREFESVILPDGRQVAIVKDMSELSAELRMQYLTDAFSKGGSWLIISNTGPLLQAIDKYGKSVDVKTADESTLLRLMDLPFDGSDLVPHTMGAFAKPLTIVNMARIDNVASAVKVLSRMVSHPSWANCSGCVAESRCALRKNRQAVADMGEVVQQRVRWVYQRLNAYDQRMTMRQMVAHLALSLTGGINCEDAIAYANDAEMLQSNHPGLERILFSESFFGFQRGEEWHEVSQIRAISLLKKQPFGGPIAPDYSRQSALPDVKRWIRLAADLLAVRDVWMQHGDSSSNSRLRYAVRRMEFFFGSANPLIGESVEKIERFFDSFLQSPKVRAYDEWRAAGAMALDGGSMSMLKRSILSVLLEYYSGFSTGQLSGQNDSVFLTLRRPGKNTVQPTQLVVAQLDFKNFSIRFDTDRRIPYLAYLDDKARLPLALPLLDYIQDRSAGRLGRGLAPIYQAQLETFRAHLLKAEESRDNDAAGVVLLRADISGAATLHRYTLVNKDQQLQKI